MEKDLRERTKDIRTFTVETKGGNTLQFFYNPWNDLVVVDLIHSSLGKGNELFRKTLDEKKLLNFKV